MRRTRDFFTETDNFYIFLATLAIGLAVLRGFPVIVPALNRGAICINLPSPEGGNNQSLLALSDGTDVPQSLELELKVLAENNGLGDPEITIGDDLNVRVTFKNEDIGPVTLFLLEDREVIGDFDQFTAQQGVGLFFEIRHVDTSSLLFDTVRQPPTQGSFTSYALEDLFMVTAKHKCYMDLNFSSARLQDIGLNRLGEYRIRVYYRNASRGVPLPPLAAPTATPMFTDQGVWSGTVQSNEVRFSVDLGDG